MKKILFVLTLILLYSCNPPTITMEYTKKEIRGCWYMIETSWEQSDQGREVQSRSFISADCDCTPLEEAIPSRQIKIK